MFLFWALLFRVFSSFEFSASNLHLLDSLYNFSYIYTDRASLNTAATARAKLFFKIVYMIIKFMHKSLSETFFCISSRIYSAGHARKDLVHAGIPASYSFRVHIIKSFFCDIKAIAGRAYKSTRTAFYAG